MRRIFIILILLTILSIFFFLRDVLIKEIGFGILSMLNVSVKEKIGGKILLSYKPSIEIGNRQEISAEFINIGTKPVSERIEVKIYTYVNGTLKPLANYFDGSYSLYPGGRRSFKCFFLPPDVGLYYIQAKSSYDTKIVEVWGAFSVVYPQAVYVPKPVAPVAPVFPVIGFPELSLEYPSYIEFYQGEKKLINVTVKNIGNASIHNLKLHISTSSLIDVTIQPKQVSILKPNESLIFIISIQIPQDLPEGTYPFEFETMNDEGVKKDGLISIVVTSLKPPEEEEILRKILSYEFMIFEIQKGINSAFLEGYDVTLANKTLNLAKLSIQKSKEYLEVGNVKECKNQLSKAESYIQQAALQLASSSIYAYKPLALTWWLIIILIIVIALCILLYLYFKRKREERPRVLRQMETEK
ncbi:MAG: hypothetical protein QXG39_00720 [Candidatus Aenigmatarchaeota archaeon]